MGNQPGVRQIAARRHTPNSAAIPKVLTRSLVAPKSPLPASHASFGSRISANSAPFAQELDPHFPNGVISPMRAQATVIRLPHFNSGRQALQVAASKASAPRLVREFRMGIGCPRFGLARIIHPLRSQQLVHIHAGFAPCSLRQPQPVHHSLYTLVSPQCPLPYLASAYHSPSHIVWELYRKARKRLELGVAALCLAFPHILPPVLRRARPRNRPRYVFGRIRHHRRHRVERLPLAFGFGLVCQ